MKLFYNHSLKLKCLLHILAAVQLIKIPALSSNPAPRKMIPYIIQQDVRTFIRGWSRRKLFWINAYICHIMFPICTESFVDVVVQTPIWCIQIIVLHETHSALLNTDFIILEY